MRLEAMLVAQRHQPRGFERRAVLGAERDTIEQLKIGGLDMMRLTSSAP